MRSLHLRLSLFAAAAAGSITTVTAFALDPMLMNSSASHVQSMLDPANSAKPGEAFFAQGVQAVRQNDYRYAADRYEVAASWGYKPAQYNLGIIYFNGEGGVPVDRPLAMAWFALAAERGDKKFVDARELAYAELSADEFARANVLWRDLKKTYADDVALDRAKQRWVEVRNSATGSHLGAVVGEMVLGSRNMSNANVFKDSATHSPVPAANSVTNTPAGVTGPGAVDASIAYRQLRATDNPYDPRFDPAHGAVTVRDPVPAGDAPAQQPVDPGAKHDRYY
jgi:hypothetical protein